MQCFFFKALIIHDWAYLLISIDHVSSKVTNIVMMVALKRASLASFV